MQDTMSLQSFYRCYYPWGFSICFSGILWNRQHLCTIRLPLCKRVWARQGTGVWFVSRASSSFLASFVAMILHCCNYLMIGSVYGGLGVPSSCMSAMAFVILERKLCSASLQATLGIMF